MLTSACNKTDQYFAYSKKWTSHCSPQALNQIRKFLKLQTSRSPSSTQPPQPVHAQSEHGCPASPFRLGFPQPDVRHSAAADCWHPDEHSSLALRFQLGFPQPGVRHSGSVFGPPQRPQNFRFLSDGPPGQLHGSGICGLSGTIGICRPGTSNSRFSTRTSRSRGCNFPSF